jgi:flotillin
MSVTSLIIIIAVAVVVVALILFAISKQYRNVGPNEVLIISGGRKRTVTEPDGTKRRIGYRTHIGGGTFVLPFVESAQVLPLDVISMSIKTPEVLTAQGVHIIAEGSSQVKVKGDDYSIRLAAENFLGKGSEGIRSIASEILEGHMRATLGSMTVEDLYRKRDEFARRVEDASKNDFDALGLGVIAFALKDFSDTQGYLAALGKPRIAQVKRDAAVAEAETDMDASIKSSEARKQGEIAKLKAEAEIARANRDYETQRAEFQADVNLKRAKADMSYDLERHRMNQQIKKEEYKVRLVEKEEGIKVEEQEIVRREMELEATVKKAADAKNYQIMKEADAESYRLALMEKGKTLAAKNHGLADAEIIKAKGEAEAEAMERKAQSYLKYNEAAVYHMFIEKLPDLARAVSEPLSKVEKIVMVDGGSGSSGASRLTGSVAQILAQLPTVVESLSGVDLKEFMGRLGKRAQDVPPEKKMEGKKEQ